MKKRMTQPDEKIKSVQMEILPTRNHSSRGPLVSQIGVPPRETMWEGELAVVIGKTVKNVKGYDALNSVAAYSVLNDLSARDWIAEPSLVGIDWVMQKAFDGFTPMGPMLTPAEFVPDPQNLSISLTVNGVVKQNSNTSKMLFSVQEIIEHLSSIMTLEPGDVIATGTPAGVEHGRKSPQYLKKGDHIVVEIEGLGKLETKMV